MSILPVALPPLPRIAESQLSEPLLSAETGFVHNLLAQPPPIPANAANTVNNNNNNNDDDDDDDYV